MNPTKLIQWVLDSIRQFTNPLQDDFRLVVGVY